jgi:hypothetical protein
LVVGKKTSGVTIEAKQGLNSYFRTNFFMKEGKIGKDLCKVYKRNHYEGGSNTYNYM